MSIRGGSILAVIGIDGAGKSSIVEELHRNLLSIGYPVDKCWCGFNDWRFLGIIPRSLRKRPLGKAESEHRTPEDLYRSSRERLPNNIARFVYYFAVSTEYILQMTVNVALPRKNGRLILCDRYFMDQAISYSAEMQSNFANRFYMKLFSLLLPNPDLVVVVLVSSKTALSRKKDIPSEKYVTDRYQKYLVLAKQNGYRILDGEQSIGKNVAEITKMITDDVIHKSEESCSRPEDMK